LPLAGSRGRLPLFDQEEEGAMSEGPVHESRSAEAAAIRWSESHPEDEVDHPAPAAVPEDDHVVPNHHSASAEAAALRWREAHEDEDE
jgi:hypothetical protein